MKRRRADNLFDRIARFDALCAAALRAAAGKRRVPGPAAFLANLETEVLRLERELQGSSGLPVLLAERQGVARRRARGYLAGRSPQRRRAWMDGETVADIESFGSVSNSE